LDLVPRGIATDRLGFLEANVVPRHGGVSPVAQGFPAEFVVPRTGIYSGTSITRGPAPLAVARQRVRRPQARPHRMPADFQHSRV
jgi:hypothetical protein